MSDRYTRVFTLEKNLYSPGSPVVVSAGALLRDSETDGILAQLKLKNISDKVITAVQVSIKAFDITNTELEGVADYQYLDLYAGRNNEFAQKRAIRLPDKTTRRFKVGVSAVVFEDGDIWNSPEDAEWRAIPRQTDLADILESKSLVEEYKRQTSPQSKYEVMDHLDLWLCSCGTPNRAEEKACSACGCKKAKLVAMADADELESRVSEAKKHQAMQKVHKKKKQSKWLVVAGIIAVIAAGLLAFSRLYTAPMEQYKTALQYMAAKDYESAIAAFEQLGNFKDAQTKAEDCRMLLQSSPVEEQYQSALTLIEQQEYEAAKEILESIIPYKDSESLIDSMLDVKYDGAVQMIASGAYDEAIAIFDELGNYKDSAAMRQQAQYEKACSFIGTDNSQAIELLSQLGDYNGSGEKILEIKYAEAVSMLEQDNPLQAFFLFKELGEYNDSQAKMEEAFYSLGEIRERSTVTFGRYNGKPIEWTVLDSSGTKILLFSRDSVEKRPYHDKLTEVTWATCSLRTWLNDTFLNAAFTPEERRAISETELTNKRNTYYRSNDSMNESYGGDDTTDRIFLLSYDSYKDYDLEDTDDSLLNRLDDYWLRNPGANNTLAFYASKGSCGPYGNEVNLPGYVRPALWLDLNMLS